MMSSLHEFQRRLADVLLGIEPDRQAGVERLEESDLAGLRIHQRTIFSALTKAVRLSFPTVVAILGDEAFARIATAYAQHHPPRTGSLNGYGAQLPSYLRRYIQDYDLAEIMFDTARLDLLIDEIGNEPLGRFGVSTTLSASMTLRLDGSLRCGSFNYCIDRLREAHPSDIPEVLRSMREPRPCHLAIWHGQEGAKVKHLSDAALTFVQALVAGDSAEKAIAAAVGDDSPEDVIRVVQREVLASSFCLIRSSDAVGANVV
jgi:Putative DNA-binding domain